MNLLGDISVSTSNAAHCDEQIVMQEVTRHSLYLIRKCGAEHEGLTIPLLWHREVINKLPNVSLEAHVKHTICFIKDQVFHLSKAYLKI